MAELRFDGTGSTSPSYTATKTPSTATIIKIGATRTGFRPKRSFPQKRMWYKGSKQTFAPDI